MRKKDTGGVLLKRFRSVSIYVRDKDGIMRSIPNVKAFSDNGKVVKVYTLPPVKLQEMNL